MHTRGIHHVTAIAGNAQRNLDFYTGTLGLRLVKQTINQDDPEVYHLFYGDGLGNPGTLLSFFVWPLAREGRAGVGQIGTVSLAVPQEALGYWTHRLIEKGVKFTGPSRRGSVQALSFKDPDGLGLELIATPDAPKAATWADMPVPEESAIRGITSAELWVLKAEASVRTLEGLGYNVVNRRENIVELAPQEGYGRVAVRETGQFLAGIEGVGTVDHVAFRVPSDEVLVELRQQVADADLSPTPVRERTYFHAVYFREPGGVLLELATEQPGFTVDEAAASLGRKLALPPRLEPGRGEIEASLPPLSVSGKDAPDGLGFIHRWLPGSDPNLTLLLLHGTGGDENDLIGLGRMLAPEASLLSLRGKVLENGMPRFFRRLSEGVFDEEDVRRRAAELADFLHQAAEVYGFSPSSLIAVGYSNGANIAVATMLTRPHLIGGAVLFRPMLPLTPEALPTLEHIPIFISSGKHDPLMPMTSVESLVKLLQQSGASVSLHWQDAGHALTDAELRDAKQWLDKLTARRAA